MKESSGIPGTSSQTASGVRDGEAGASLGHLFGIAPPFTRKNLGSLYEWFDDLLIAQAFAEEFGLEFVRATADYQVAKLIGHDVRLVIYPHKTTQGNRHLRVRDENSKNKSRAQALMALLDRAAGFNCTFSFHWTANLLARRHGLDLSSEAGRARALSAAKPHDTSDRQRNPGRPA